MHTARGRRVGLGLTAAYGAALRGQSDPARTVDRWVRVINNHYFYGPLTTAPQIYDICYYVPRRRQRHYSTAAATAAMRVYAVYAAM